MQNVSRRMARWIFLVAVFLLLTCTKKESVVEIPTTPDSIPRMVPLILRQFRHFYLDVTQAYTQGFLFYDGYLYESTGLNCCSSVRKLDAMTGALVRWVPVEGPCEFNGNPVSCFGEGLARIGQLLYQLTWHSEQGFVYSIAFLQREDSFAYKGEGWGLTTIDSTFIMSNGTDTLYFRDRNFDVTRMLPVRMSGVPLRKLNELEYVDSLVYANVLKRDSVFAIDPQTGDVVQVIDCTNLKEIANPSYPQYVLNGIAYDDSTGFFYLTGKNWPMIFEVIFVEP